MEKIKILLVEDDVVWQEHIKRFLHAEGDISVIYITASKEDAIDYAKKQDIDIILMDISLSDNQYEGIAAALEISRFSKAKVLMLTSLSQDEVIIDSFTAGAIDFISKVNYKQLPDRIRLACKNTTPFEVLLKEYSKLKKENQLKDLTPAEREIYDLLEEGYTKSKIESTLYKSSGTLKNQIRHILKKLSVKSSKEAVQKIKSLGLKDSGKTKKL
ncbi:MAG: response regulator transcription factor [Clostridia bacterium]|nr:response regulator transcription factor [Clostridia bacterium]